MPLEFALGAINEKYIWLCNPALWKDPFERRFIEAKYLVNGKEVDFPLKGQIFCTCLTQTITSEAHWNNYPNGQIGISFKINRKKLLQALDVYSSDYEIYVGRVEYIKSSELKKKLSDIDHINKIHPFRISNRMLQIKMLLLKRIAFQYEDEIRILAVKKYKTKKVE